MLSNVNFPLENQRYTKSLYETLMKVVRDSLNFKVKTGALLALASPLNINDYQYEDNNGKQVVMDILESVRYSLETIENVNTSSNHDELKYQGNFMDTLDIVLEHFKSITVWDEFKGIEQSILHLKAEISAPKKFNFNSNGE
jgi:hypothetical protein